MRFLHGYDANYALVYAFAQRHPRAMDLYATPMSCSFAVHIAFLESGLPFTIRWVERGNKRLPDGSDYVALVPKGVVPAVKLEDGSILTETSAIFQLIADGAPDTHLVPSPGTLDRYRVFEWLNFVSTELHAKHLGSIFGRTVPDVIKARAHELIVKPLAYVNDILAKREVLVGDRFTVADAYLFWVLFGAPYGGVKLDAFPALVAYVARHSQRPSIQAALGVDGPLYLKEQQRAA
jgi:glutathione S-transferase